MVSKIIKERFESKYQKVSSRCWEWTACLNNDGYGEFWDTNCLIRAHRFSYELYVDTIPTGICVLHKCRNRKCVNPEHLYLGTRADNLCDAVADGASFGPSKLTEEDVVSIRKMLRDGIKQRLIAPIYQVTQMTVSDINRCKTWRHVTI